MGKGEKWVPVFKAAGLPQAYIVKGRLESFGIPVKLSYEAIGKIYGITVDGLGEVSILVRQDDLEEALQLLEETEEIGEEWR